MSKDIRGVVQELQCRGVVFGRQGNPVVLERPVKVLLNTEQYPKGECIQCGAITMSTFVAECMVTDSGHTEK